MKVEDILSNKEMEEYYKQWNQFSGKFTPEHPYNAHSNLPVIGKVLQYKDKPVFRAKVLKSTLKKINPYFTDPKYPHANLHLMHYFLPIEQIGHASLERLIPDYHQFMITEKFNSKKPIMANKRIHFDKNHPSIELIADLKQGKNRLVLRGDFTFYEDNDNSVLQAWFLEGLGEFREYANCIRQLKEEHNPEVAKNLIKKIKVRSEKRLEMLKQRKNLPDRDYLINQLKKGNLPEKELHNYFSDWDRPNSPYIKTSA